MIERAFSAIRPAASILVDKNLEIGIPAGLVFLCMDLILSIHRLCQLPLPPGRRCCRRAHRRAMRRDDFSRTLPSELAYAIFDPWGARAAAPRGMKRRGRIDDENDEMVA